MQKVIAIDGPSGSGKSTVAKKLAREMQFTYVDTGAMYRALALHLDRAGVLFEEGLPLSAALAHTKFEYGESPERLVVVNGKNLTHDIRDHRVSDLASRLSKLPSVRHFLLETQRNLAQEKFCVMEGRDIGTVIFPQALLKIFLTASAEERAKRRWQELQVLGQTPPSLEQIKEDIILRDKRDSERAQAPLVQAKDAVLLDSTGINVDEVLKKIETLAKKRANDLNIKLH